MSLTVHTERLVIRRLIRSDRERYLDLLASSEDHLRPWRPFRDDTPDEHFEATIAKAERTESHFRGVAVRDDDQIVGLFNLHEIVRGVFQSAYAGWSLGAAYTGQGYATEALNALLDLAFSTGEGLGLHRVQANIMPENEASRRLAERVGMRVEGTAHRYLHIGGSWRDHLMYAKTAEEHTAIYLG